MEPMAIRYHFPSFSNTWQGLQWSIDTSDLDVADIEPSTGKTVIEWVISEKLLLDFSLTVRAATLIFISGRGWAISPAKEGKSGFIYNSVNS